MALLFGSFVVPARIVGAAAQQGEIRTAVPCSTGVGMTPAFEGTMPEAAEDAAEVEFDQFFIAMNIPHHAAIVAGAVSAMTRIEDPPRRAVAADIVADQAAELDELPGLHERLYDDSVPMPVDEQMPAMMQTMPGMAGVDPAGLAVHLDPAAFAARMRSAEEVDLTFIDLTIAHHEVAIMMAPAALNKRRARRFENSLGTR